MSGNGLTIGDTLREWKLCPKRTENLVFPTGVGTVDYLANFMHRYVQPAQVAAGVVDSKGKAKYGTSTPPGVHPPEGRWRPRAAAKDRSGAAGTPRASIVMTLDRYGHLFPAHDDGGELAAAARALFAT